MSMGVYIKGMEMPKGNDAVTIIGKCDRCVWLHNGGCSEWNGMAEVASDG